MARVFAERVAGVPWSVLGLVALIIAGIYVVVDTAGAASGWQWVVVRWFHSLCWLLLAGAALLMARLSPLPATWAGPMGVAGAVVYGVFIATTLFGKG